MSDTSSNTAVMRAQQMLQQLRQSYLAELGERIDELEQLALGLKNTQDFPGQFGELYRKTHSIKGSAGTYGLQIITVICHQLEEALTELGNDASRVDDSFLDRCSAFFDLMRQAASGALRGQNSFPDVESALNALRASVAGKRLTVLLVEPSKVNATLFLGMLKHLPLQISMVESGYAALDLLLHSHFDVLITGYETPLLNGLALIGAVRLSGGVNQGIHAVLLTSSTGLPMPAACQPDVVVQRDARVGQALQQAVQNYLQTHGVPV